MKITEIDRKLLRVLRKLEVTPDELRVIKKVIKKKRERHKPSEGATVLGVMLSLPWVGQIGWTEITRRLMHSEYS